MGLLGVVAKTASSPGFSPFSFARSTISLRRQHNDDLNYNLPVHQSPAPQLIGGAAAGSRQQAAAAQLRAISAHNWAQNQWRAQCSTAAAAAAVAAPIAVGPQRQLPLQRAGEARPLLLPLALGRSPLGADVPLLGDILRFEGALRLRLRRLLIQASRQAGLEKAGAQAGRAGSAAAAASCHTVAVIGALAGRLPCPANSE